MVDKQAEKKDIPISRMIGWVMVFVAYFCWGIAASSYLDPIVTPDSEMARVGGIKLFFGGIITFFVNSLRIDKVIPVISHVFTARISIFWTFLILESFFVLFGFWLKVVEKELNPPKKKRRKKKPKVRPEVK